MKDIVALQEREDMNCIRMSWIEHFRLNALPSQPPCFTLYLRCTSVDFIAAQMTNKENPGCYKPFHLNTRPAFCEMEIPSDDEVEVEYEPLPPVQFQVRGQQNTKFPQRDMPMTELSFKTSSAPLFENFITRRNNHTEFSTV